MLLPAPGVQCWLNRLRTSLISNSPILLVLSLINVLSVTGDWSSVNFSPRNKQLENGDLKVVSGSSISSNINSIPSKIKSAASLFQQQPPQLQENYRCAMYCTCSTVHIATTHSRPGTNLSLTSCESAQFSDLLTIDKRTQIIHISLPKNDSSNNTSSDRKRLVGSYNGNFRLPRLMQFVNLRELVIVNLRFQVCDSEVFKRGSRVRRLRLNSNHLARLSKSCFKHLDKLIELNLNHNLLDELESALFSSLLSLRSLSIAHNRLADLAAHQFTNLTQLSYLNLVGNYFKTINLQLLEPMQSTLRQLMLSKNLLKSFVYVQQALLSTNSSIQARPSTSPSLAGIVFKNLVKLNIDYNRFERIKLLQLHRFFNVKFLSIRYNQISSIRDRAFNGLKLIELNLASNQLQSLSRCAFCNATIKRLIVAQNNITLPPVIYPILQAPAAMTQQAITSQPSPPLISANLVLPTLGQTQGFANSLAQSQSQQQPNMLILSQSLLGPLFAHLEYLDLAGNGQLLGLAPDQLDLLLEPLLKLEYLNLASAGIEKTLPSPHVFKNLRQLRYLNLSHNQLDQITAETIEPLSSLEVLDLSHNKFSELEESFIVSMDELASLKMVNLGSNSWYCSQCKVAPLYDWILRSPIYNYTCIAPSSLDLSSDEPKLIESMKSKDTTNAYYPLIYEDDLLSGTQTSDKIEDSLAVLEFDMSFNSLGTNSTPGQPSDHLLADYNLLSGRPNAPSDLTTATWIAELESEDDDLSVGKTIQSLVDAQFSFGSSPGDFCLRCEFPSELSQYQLHELSPGDFKFCAGAAPRYAASEPKIGLTLAIVIICALLCIIIVVIIMYRKKGNTYYPSDDTDQLERDLEEGARSGSAHGKRGQQVTSMSSDAEQQYGDGTDYSSPPISQSYESSFSQGEDEENYDEQVDEEEFEDEEEELEDIDANGVEEELELQMNDVDDTQASPPIAEKFKQKSQVSTVISRGSPGSSNKSTELNRQSSNDLKRPLRSLSSLKHNDSSLTASPASIGPASRPHRQSSRSATSETPLAEAQGNQRSGTASSGTPSVGGQIESRAPTLNNSGTGSGGSLASDEQIEIQSSSAMPAASRTATRILDHAVSVEGSQSAQSVSSKNGSVSQQAVKRAQTIQIGHSEAATASSQGKSSKVSSKSAIPEPSIVTGKDDPALPSSFAAQPQGALQVHRKQASQSRELSMDGAYSTRASQTSPTILDQFSTSLRPLSAGGARLSLARQSPASSDRRPQARPMRLSAIGAAMANQTHQLQQRSQPEPLRPDTSSRHAGLMSPSMSDDATTADSLALELADFPEVEDDLVELARSNLAAEHRQDDDASSYEQESRGGAALVCSVDELNSLEHNH